MAFRIRLSLILLPRSMDTLGPISLRSMVTSSSMYTGSCRVTPAQSRWLR